MTSLLNYHHVSTPIIVIYVYIFFMVHIIITLFHKSFYHTFNLNASFYYELILIYR